MHAEGYSRLTYELEPQGDTVKLTVIHEMDQPDSKWFVADLVGEMRMERRRFPLGDVRFTHA